MLVERKYIFFSDIFKKIKMAVNMNVRKKSFFFYFINVGCLIYIKIGFKNQLLTYI